MNLWRLALIGATTCHVAASGPNQSSLPVSNNDVAIFLQQEGYVATQYAKLEGGAADYLYLEGEQVSFRIELINRGTEPISFFFDKRSTNKGIHLELGSVLGNDWTPMPARFTRLADPSVVTSGVIQPEARRVEFDPQILRPLGAWRISSALTPRLYQLRVIDINSPCEPRCRVVNHAGPLRFEVRSTKDLPEQLDFIFRKAWRALDAGDGKRAKPLIEEMLKLHPVSVAGYRLKARYLEGVRDRDGAAAAQAEASRLLKSRADSLFLWNDIREYGDSGGASPAGVR